MYDSTDATNGKPNPDGPRRGRSSADLRREEREQKQRDQQAQRDWLKKERAILAGLTGEPLPEDDTEGENNSGSGVTFAPETQKPDPFQPFPVEHLPEPLGSFTDTAATAIGCDPSFVALRDSVHAKPWQSTEQFTRTGSDSREQDPKWRLQGTHAPPSRVC